MYLHHPSYTTCQISFPLHILPPLCIQPTQVKCNCLLSFWIIILKMASEKGPKHVVLYVINYTYLYHHIVVLDKYTQSNLGTSCLQRIFWAAAFHWNTVSCMSPSCVNTGYVGGFFKVGTDVKIMWWYIKAVWRIILELRPYGSLS